MAAPGQRTLRSSTANMGAQMQEGGGGLSNTGPGSSEKQPLSEEGKASVTLISGQKSTEEQGRDRHTMTSDARAMAAGEVEGGLSNTAPGSSEKQPLSEEGKASVTLISGQTPTEEQGRDPHTMSSDAQAPWVGSGGGHGDGSDEVDAWGMHLSPSLC